MSQGILARRILVALALVAIEGMGRAQEERPLMVEYVAPAPPHCASVKAFQALVSAELARMPGPHEDRQFSVHIGPVHGEYVGTVTSETHASSAHSCDCADVTAALARAIASAGADPDPQPSPAEAPSLGVPDAPSSPIDAEDVPPPSPPPVRRAAEPALWRLGARVQTWSHGALSVDGRGNAVPSYGVMGVLSVELPVGIRKTLLEAALGGMDSSSPNEHLNYMVLDTQACLIDLPMGSGFSALGCTRLAMGSFTAVDSIYGHNSGGALWFGAGGRLRWQSQGSVFLELHLNAVYGTVSAGEDTRPGWGDAGATLGLRL
jgi:hypothetical protein